MKILQWKNGRAFALPDSFTTPLLTPLLGVLFLALAGSSCKKDPVAVPKAPVKPPALSAVAIAPGDAVVYEAFVRQTSPEGTFEGLLPRLDSIKALGCNVLWLMPVHPIGLVRRVGSLGSPYAVRDYQNVNTEYGNLTAFDRLVTAAHDRKMAVILDWVANHTAWDHPWVTAHPDWYTKDAAGNIKPPIPEWQDVADLNYDNAALRKEMIQAMKFWVKDHGVDGFRADAADMVPDAFWKEAIDTLNTLRTNLFWLAEAGNAATYNSGFQMGYGWDFYQALKQAINDGSPVQRLTEAHNREASAMPAGRFRLRFSTNHDYSFTEGTPPELYRSKEAAQAAFVATLAYGAAPLVYNGQEAGDPARLNLFEKTTIRWEADPAVTAFYKRVLNLYNSLPALRTGSITPNASSPNVVTVLRANSQQRVAVFVNLRNQPSTVSIPFGWPATAWVDAMTGTPISPTTSITLPAYGYAIWRSQ